MRRTLPDQVLKTAAERQREEAGTKNARAVVPFVIGRVHESFRPRHAPAHERSLQPLAGFAVSRTGTCEARDAAHRFPHEIPPRELRTDPCPPTETASRYVRGAKSAVTTRPAATDSAHAPAPVHAPLQRTSFEDGLAAASS